MKRIALGALATVLALLIWSAGFLAGELGGWWRAPLAPPGDARAFMEAAIAKSEAGAAGDIAFVLIEDGIIIGEHYASIGRPVDRDTLFQVASLSKWISALGVMTLVEQGKLDLDTPVSTYLTRWTLPASEYDNDGVTVRRLLSHMAGLTDGLGYGGFAPGAPIQTLEDSLTHASDASPGHSGIVRVGQEPGAQWLYSGGGYALLQLLVEEVSGEPFNTYMRRAVLYPLGMTHSTFVLDASNEADVADLFDAAGQPATHFRFSAIAPVSLYTSAADLARLIAAHRPGPNGDAIGRGVLRPETLEEMRRPRASQLGFPIWGLGAMLYAPNRTGSFIIGHDGSNDPAINTAARLDPDTGDGIVVLETGDPLLATQLAGEWVFWNVGAVDFLTVTMQMRRMLAVLIAGWIVILVAGIALTIWPRRKAQRI